MQLLPNRTRKGKFPNRIRKFCKLLILEPINNGKPNRLFVVRLCVQGRDKVLARLWQQFLPGKLVGVELRAVAFIPLKETGSGVYCICRPCTNVMPGLRRRGGNGESQQGQQRLGRFILQRLMPNSIS